MNFDNAKNMITNAVRSHLAKIHKFSFVTVRLSPARCNSREDRTAECKRKEEEEDAGETNDRKVEQTFGANHSSRIYSTAGKTKRELECERTLHIWSHRIEENKKEEERDGGRVERSDCCARDNETNKQIVSNNKLRLQPRAKLRVPFRMDGRKLERFKCENN